MGEEGPSPRPGPVVEKSVWSEADFDRMGWHDVTVHAFAVQPSRQDPGRLLLDLDYIVEWVSPARPEDSLGFWISPATFVFDQAWDLAIDVDLHDIAFALQLDRITRELSGPHGRSRWELHSHHGLSVAVTSVGYR